MSIIKLNPDDFFHFPNVVLKPASNLVNYTGSNFIGKKIKVDEQFATYLEEINVEAKILGIQLFITSCFREPGIKFDGAIVKPASNSCHHVGHAIDMNIVYGNEFFNSKKLIRTNFENLPQPVVSFLTWLTDHDVLRWGGNFSKPDTVHIDDNIYHRNKALYMLKFDEIVGNKKPH